MRHSNDKRSLRSWGRKLREWFVSNPIEFRRSTLERLERRDLFDASGFSEPSLFAEPLASSTAITNTPVDTSKKTPDPMPMAIRSSLRSKEGLHGRN